MPWQELFVEISSDEEESKSKPEEGSLFKRDPVLRKFLKLAWSKQRSLLPGSPVVLVFSL